MSDPLTGGAPGAPPDSVSTPSAEVAPPNATPSPDVDMLHEHPERPDAEYPGIFIEEAEDDVPRPSHSELNLGNLDPPESMGLITSALTTAAQFLMINDLSSFCREESSVYQSHVAPLCSALFMLISVYSKCSGEAPTVLIPNYRPPPGTSTVYAARPVPPLSAPRPPRAPRARPNPMPRGQSAVWPSFADVTRSGPRGQAAASLEMITSLGSAFPSASVSNLSRIGPS